MDINLRQLLMTATALDIETAPESGHPQEYALQPWRVYEDSAKITCISIARHTGAAKLSISDWRSLLVSLKGQYITTWNGVFDVAWLIANGLWDEVNAIHWVDVMLLWKWVSNSQRRERMPKWSLADGAKRWCKDEPWLDAFIEMKKAEVHAGENDAYWETRAKLDAIVTAKICHAVVPHLTDQQIRSAMIEAACIPVVARSWLIGVDFDYTLVDSIRPDVVMEMRNIEFSLGVSNFSGASEDRVKRDMQFWSPSKILRSPDKTGTLLFETWGLTAKTFSEKTDKPKTDKAALTYLADHDDRAIEILRWKELNTRLSKYIESPKKARVYLNSDTTHPSPKLFSTYTGRMTYASKTKKKYHTGIALHQWPREEEYRALLKPPAGYKHVEYDAAGQESRIMAEKSGDLAMQDVFKQGRKFHAVTGARLAGLSYEDFMTAYDAKNSAVYGPHGFYYQGKFTGLSNNFRIGVKNLRIKARVGYGMNVDFFKAKEWQDAFFHNFPGIKPYWSKSIRKGKELGYAETLGGRRFGLEFWDKENRWGTESSSLMFPIQGSGADMKELALRDLSRHYPEQIFWFDLHDGLHMLVPVDYPDSKILETREMLNNLDYAAEWGVNLTVPLTWDAQVGARWSELKEL